MIINRNGMSGCGCQSNGNCGCSGMGDFTEILPAAQQWLTPSGLPAAFSAAISPLNPWALAGLAIVPLAAFMLLSGKHRF
jgi:hypothetical protein